MKIKTVATKEVVTETELTLPSFWKYNDGKNAIAIYEDESTVRAGSTTSNFHDITRCPFSCLYKTEQYFEGEQITEQEFNAILSESIFKIAGVSLDMADDQPKVSDRGNLLVTALQY